MASLVQIHHSLEGLSLAETHFTSWEFIWVFVCVRLGSCCLKISSPCGHYTLILLSWLLLVPIDIGSKAFRSHIKSLSQVHEDPLVFFPECYWVCNLALRGQAEQTHRNSVMILNTASVVSVGVCEQVCVWQCVILCVSLPCMVCQCCPEGWASIHCSRGEL